MRIGCHCLSERQGVVLRCQGLGRRDHSLARVLQVAWQEKRLVVGKGVHKRHEKQNPATVSHHLEILPK